MRSTGKKRIVCMTHLPPPVNGVTLMGDLVAKSGVLKEGFDVRVIPFRSSESISDIGSYNFRKVLRTFYFAWVLLKQCILLKPDLVYFTLTPSGMAFYRDILYVLIIKLTRTPRVYHLHGKGVTRATRSPLAKAIYRWAFRNSSVILLSPLLYDDIATVVERKQCFYLPNGIPEACPVQSLESSVSHTHPPHILFLSNLVENKGPLVLLQALADVHRKGVQFRASFAGVWESPAFRDTFVDYVAKNDLSSLVSYLGPKYGDEKEALLSSADIFAFPTYNDAYPLVILEAMRHGLPVVTTYEGAIPDMVRDEENGFLVQPRDTVSLSDCLVKLLEDSSLREKMGRVGKNRYQEEFTQSVFERNLSMILENVCQ